MKVRLSGGGSCAMEPGMGRGLGCWRKWIDWEFMGSESQSDAQRRQINGQNVRTDGICDTTTPQWSGVLHDEH